MGLLLGLVGACHATTSTTSTTTLVVAQGDTAPALQVAQNSDAAGGPTIRCSGAARALAGQPVQLRAEATGEGVRVRWSVTRSPQARIYRFADVFRNEDSDAVVAVGPATPFTSVIVGDYVVEAQARDSEGRSARCEVPVAMVGHGLRVELSWNTSNTDVDLHMATTPAASQDHPRYFNPQDCYYANRTPDGAQQEGPARWLDTDDTDGEGPENIRVDVPDATLDYHVGVHFYSSHGSSDDSTAIVVIYCGEQRVARYEHSLDGHRGSPMENDFWSVADVRFRPGNGVACEVRPVNGTAHAQSMSQ